ncbi:MAG: sulfatase-like hydrolase/transferase, partial [Planctomycetaceae bacterium]
MLANSSGAGEPDAQLPLSETPVNCSGPENRMLHIRVWKRLRQRPVLLNHNGKQLMRLHFFATLLTFTGLIAAETAAETQPNIIFILADDLGYGDLGCYGQKLIRTPRLDRMAAEGMRFTDFYAGNTVCAPSRSVLMTGQH